MTIAEESRMPLHDRFVGLMISKIITLRYLAGMTNAVAIKSAPAVITVKTKFECTYEKIVISVSSRQFIGKSEHVRRQPPLPVYSPSKCATIRRACA